jgi:hypothetical protein
LSVYKTILLVTDAAAKKARLFISGNIFQPGNILHVRLEPTRVELNTVDPLKSKLLALPTNIRLGWKCLPVTTTLAYLASLSMTEKNVL